MNRDILILIAAWIITTIILVCYIPKEKIREAQLVFLFILLITWLIGLLVVEFGLIEYPVEFFQHATQTSFTFEYFIFPALCAVFNINYPENKSIFKQVMHYVNFCSVMTLIEVICERFTNIITYLHWTWYLTWITLFITFYLSRQYYRWFFKLKNDSQGT